MTKYVDVDKLRNDFMNWRELVDNKYDLDPSIDECLRILDVQPAADVVEVVRCKDCDLWNEWDESGHEQTGNYACSCAYFSNEDGYAVYTGPDDYCSYGERKEVQG